MPHSADARFYFRSLDSEQGAKDGRGKRKGSDMRPIKGHARGVPLSPSEFLCCSARRALDARRKRGSTVFSGRGSTLPPLPSRFPSSRRCLKLETGDWDERHLKTDLFGGSKSDSELRASNDGIPRAFTFSPTLELPLVFGSYIRVKLGLNRVGLEVDFPCANSKNSARAGEARGWRVLCPHQHGNCLGALAG